MRRLALVLGFALLAAAPAGAQQGRIDPVTPSAREAGLRGTEGAAPALAPPATALTPSRPSTESAVLIPEATPAVLADPPLDAAACRTSCAQTYYFCSADEPMGCSQGWGQCVRSCSLLDAP